MKIATNEENACGWFQLEDGKISSLRVTFDPRPLLALSEAS
jgi:hypothetical protein